MDRTNYQRAMLVEMVSLTMLVSSLPLTYYGGRLMFAAWIWAVYFTFPGTFSTQPAVTTQTFGHKYGGTIYGFLFTSDILNNFLVGALSTSLLRWGGWSAMFVTLSVFSLIAFFITLLYPKSPRPGLLRQAPNKNEELGVEIRQENSKRGEDRLDVQESNLSSQADGSEEIEVRLLDNSKQLESMPS